MANVPIHRMATVLAEKSPLFTRGADQFSYPRAPCSAFSLAPHARHPERGILAEMTLVDPIFVAWVLYAAVAGVWTAVLAARRRPRGNGAPWPGRFNGPSPGPPYLSAL